MKRAPDYALRGGPGAPPRVPCAAPCRRAIENRSPASFQRPQIASRARRRHRSWSAQSVARVVQCSVVPVDERARHSNINSRTASAAERTASGLRSKFFRRLRRAQTANAPFLPVTLIHIPTFDEDTVGSQPEILAVRLASRICLSATLHVFGFLVALGHIDRRPGLCKAPGLDASRSVRKS